MSNLINPKLREKTIKFYNKLNSDQNLYLDELKLDNYLKLTDSTYLKVIKVDLIFLKSTLTRTYLQKSYSRRF